MKKLTLQKRQQMMTETILKAGAVDGVEREPVSTWKRWPQEKVENTSAAE